METSSDAPLPDEPRRGEGPRASRPRPGPRRHGAPHRRRARLRRRLAGLALLFVPTAWVVSTDLLRRAHLIAAFDAPHRKGYLASLVESWLFWTVVLLAGARRRGAAAAVMSGVFLALFTLSMGVEGAFHGFYNIYLSMDGQIHSKSIRCGGTWNAMAA